MDHILNNICEVIEFWVGLRARLLGRMKVSDAIRPLHLGCGERHHRGVQVRAQRGPHAPENHIRHGVDLGCIWLRGEAVTPRVLRRGSAYRLRL